MFETKSMFKSKQSIDRNIVRWQQYVSIKVTKKDTFIETVSFVKLKF